ncbi:MAG: hypothetical protein HQL56_17100 [Magnetococcales bacterium]|nr:hypothetical protein [Magnetococcales bacterium]
MNIDLSFHGLAHIAGRDLPPFLGETLRHHWSHFLVSAPARLPTETIRLETLPPHHPLAGETLADLPWRPFHLLDRPPQAEEPLRLFYRNQLDLLVYFGPEEFRVLCAPRPGIGGKLLDLLQFLLQLLLARRKSLIGHGSVVAKEGRCLLITGLEDTKKTLLMLEFLRHGWDFLADDKFILHEGEILFYRQVIPLRLHHFTFLPWLNERLKADAFLRRARSHRAMQRLGRSLPKPLMPLVERLFPDPSLDLPMERLFPKTRLLQRARPTELILLVHGAAFGPTPIDQSAVFRELGIINELLFDAFLPLERHLVYYGYIPAIPYREILESQLAAVKPHRFTLPLRGEFAPQAQAIRLAVSS